MIEYYRSVRGAVTRLEDYAPGCWVNVVAPTPDELTYLTEGRGVPLDYLLYSLDLDERPRFERDDEFVLIVMQTSFAFGGERVIMEFGIGFAMAVLIDAFLIRCLLLPAVLHLLGDATWRLPAWLDRILPHWALELEDDGAPAALEPEPAQA